MRAPTPRHTSRRPTHRHRAATAAAAGALAVGAVLAGTGTATAAPTADDTVQFSPTATLAPAACGAIITAATLPQKKSGEFAVKALVSEFGVGWQGFELYINWRNLDTGLTGGQQQRVDANGRMPMFPDGVITGFGTGPGKGRVSATITTGRSPGYPDKAPLPNWAGHATFTLT